MGNTETVNMDVHMGFVIVSEIAKIVVIKSYSSVQLVTKKETLYNSFFNSVRFIGPPLKRQSATHKNHSLS